jgi:hypothetical protein
MPQLKQPLTLQEMARRAYCKIYCAKCAKWFENWLNALLCCRGDNLFVLSSILDESREMANNLSTCAPDLLKSLSPRLAKEFGKIICNYDILASELRDTSWDGRGHLSLCSAVFRSVLSRFIQNFDTNIASEEIGHLIIVENLDCVPNLLEFSIVPFTEDHSAVLATKIHHLTNLQIFKYHCYCTDEIVELLRMHCSHLTEVDISASVGVTNASVQHLMELRELKCLNVQGTGIDDEHYAMILSELPNIASIRFWQNEASILSHITLERLDTITHISGSVLDINTLIQKCPNTTNITLSSNFGDLSGLATLNALRVLKFYDLDYGGSNLTAVMRRIGRSLTDLNVFQGTSVNLEEIITLCPSLVNLSLRSCSFLDLNVNQPFDDPQMPHFKNLIFLNIDNFSRESATIFSFIRYYVSLKTIHLRHINFFTVDFVREILTLGTFKQLEVLQLKEELPGAVTIEALRMLIGHCPLLQCIKGMRSCPRFNSHLIRQLKDEIKSQNFDLEIED